MRRFGIRTALSTALMAGAIATGGIAAGLTGINPAVASAPKPAPAGIDSLHPTVSGFLVARPHEGEGNLPQACRDRDQAMVARDTQINRGLVICTEEGRLVLLQLSRVTHYFARYWGRIGIQRLRDGDHINAYGVLRDNGYLLNPTIVVQDTDLQRAFTNSQDFISARDGAILTLAVLRSDSQGPVTGIVHAAPGGRVRVTLCGGQQGTWADLTPGKTININDSLFNSRLHVYFEVTKARVVSCP